MILALSIYFLSTIPLVRAAHKHFGTLRNYLVLLGIPYHLCETDWRELPNVALKDQDLKECKVSPSQNILSQHEIWYLRSSVVFHIHLDFVFQACHRQCQRQPREIYIVSSFPHHNWFYPAIITLLKTKNDFSLCPRHRSSYLDNGSNKNSAESYQCFGEGSKIWWCGHRCSETVGIRTKLPGVSWESP